METVQTSLFQRFGAESELLARHGIRQPVPVKIQCQPGPWRGSRDPGLQPFLPYPGSLHPHRRFKAFRHHQQAGWTKPVRRRMDRPAATLKPFPRHHRLCRIAPPSPTPRQLTETIVLRLLLHLLVHRWDVLRPSLPKPRQGRLPAPRSLRPEGTGIPVEADPIFGTGHNFVKEGFHRVGIGSDSLPTGVMKRQPGTLPTPSRTLLPVLVDNPDSPA